MLRRYGLIYPALVLTVGMFSGCSSFGIKNGVPYFSKQAQYEPADEEEDKWSLAGKLGRGNRALDDEHDPLKPILMSKEAQDIERNLGYK